MYVLYSCSSSSSSSNNNNNNNNNKQYIKRDTIQCVLNYTSPDVRKQGYIWTKKHWYEHVPKSVETGQGGNLTILWNEQVFLPAFQIAKLLYVSAIQVQTLNWLHLDRFVGYK